jgi:hypothetical protein
LEEEGEWFFIDAKKIRVTSQLTEREKGHTTNNEASHVSESALKGVVVHVDCAKQVEHLRDTEILNKKA